MLDAHSVITEATKGHIEELAKRREVSLRRMYEVLSKDCPYVRAKRLIRDIAALNQDGARLIKADLDAMFEDILDPIAEPVTDCELVKELNDAEHAQVAKAPRPIRLKENREAIEVLSRVNAQLENESSGVIPIREDMRVAVEKRRNGHK